MTALRFAVAFLEVAQMRDEVSALPRDDRVHLDRTVLAARCIVNLSSERSEITDPIPLIARRDPFRFRAQFETVERRACPITLVVKLAYVALVRLVKLSPICSRIFDVLELLERLERKPK